MVAIALSWHGLPQFAARLFRGALDELSLMGLSAAVIGTPPEVPVKGMEEALGQEIHWVDAGKPVRWRDLGLSVPRCFVQSGWSYPALSSLGREVKQAGGHVIGLSDTNWRGDFRQLVLGPLAFRWRYRREFDAMIVAGQQGKRIMQWFGLPAGRIRVGMLGADPALFKPGPPLAGRPKRFLFVGQFVARKDVLGLVEAFLRFRGRQPDWHLHLCGSGIQRSQIPSHPNIAVEDFVQPEDLPARFQQARFFVLPSLYEPWGVVVHEAVSSGCALILSDRIGSADDLSAPQNALRFQAGDIEGLVRALDDAARKPGDWLAAAEAQSLSLAAQFGPARFGREVASLVRDFSEES